MGSGVGLWREVAGAQGCALPVNLTLVPGTAALGKNRDTPSVTTGIPSNEANEWA